MSSKKLQIISLASLSALVIAFVFVAVSFTSSSTLARPTQQNSPTLPPPISREVYKVTAGNGDAAAVNVRDENCDVIGTLKINTIVAIRGTSGNDAKKCNNDSGNEIELYKLSETRNGKAMYIAKSNLVKRNANEAFNQNNQAQVASPRGLRIRDDQCKLLNESDNKIPKALKNGTIVTLPDPNNVETTTCDINDGGLFRFEMVKVNFEYKIGKETRTGTGYVAQEFLMPAQAQAQKRKIFKCCI